MLPWFYKSNFKRSPAWVCFDILFKKSNLFTQFALISSFPDIDNWENFIIETPENEIKDIDQSLLGAKFECSIALVDKSQELELVVDGQMPGEVIKEVRGQNGFGYDPIFYPENNIQAFFEPSEMPTHSKEYLFQKTTQLLNSQRLPDN